MPCLGIVFIVKMISHQNPNIEIRNSKQNKSTNSQMLKTEATIAFMFRLFEFWSLNIVPHPGF